MIKLFFLLITPLENKTMNHEMKLLSNIFKANFQKPFVM